MPGELLSDAPRAALFGKLPAHGDFVRRGDAALVRRLDRWLTAEVERAADGDRADGLASLSTWCFTLPGGYAGALASSYDRVGRIFPVIAATAGGEAAAEQVADLLERERDAGADADDVVAALAALLSGQSGSKGWPRWWLRSDEDEGAARPPDFTGLAGALR